MTDDTLPERIHVWRYTGERAKGAWCTAKASHAEATYVPADALDAAHAERDAALARLAELEGQNSEQDSLVEKYSDDPLAAAVAIVWGERCETTDVEDFGVDILGWGECPCCKAWRAYDRAALKGTRHD